MSTPPKVSGFGNFVSAEPGIVVSSSQGIQISEEAPPPGFGVRSLQEITYVQGAILFVFSPAAQVFSGDQIVAMWRDALPKWRRLTQTGGATLKIYVPTSVFESTTGAYIAGATTYIPFDVSERVVFSLPDVVTLTDAAVNNCAVQPLGRISRWSRSASSLRANTQLEVFAGYRGNPLRRQPSVSHQNDQSNAPSDLGLYDVWHDGLYSVWPGFTLDYTTAIQMSDRAYPLRCLDLPVLRAPQGAFALQDPAPLQMENFGADNPNHFTVDALNPFSDVIFALLPGPGQFCIFCAEFEGASNTGGPIMLTFSSGGSTAAWRRNQAFPSMIVPYPPYGSSNALFFTVDGDREAASTLVQFGPLIYPMTYGSVTGSVRYYMTAPIAKSALALQYLSAGGDQREVVSSQGLYGPVADTARIMSLLYV